MDFRKKHLVFLALAFALYCAADFANDARAYAGTVIPGGDSEYGPVIQKARAPVPLEDSQQDAERFVRIHFKDALAVQTRASRSISARQFLEEARASKHRDAVTYVLLLKARDLAVSAADFDTAADAIGDLSRIYEVAGPPMKLAALTSVWNESESPRVGAEVMARHALWIADEAIEADDYQTATQSAALAAECATRSNNPALVDGIQEYRIQLTQRVLDYGAFSDARALLSHDPDNANANLAAGRFLSFDKEEWDQGLPMLLRDSDPALRKLAAIESPHQPDWRAEVAAGDAWWGYALAQSGLVRQGARARACDFYHSAILHAQSGSPQWQAAQRVAAARIAEVRRDQMQSWARERAQKLADQRIVFVCDATGSMINAWASVKVELSAEMDALPPASNFSILIFQDETVEAIAGHFLTAAPENKLRATRYIDGILTTGSTNPLIALERAFQERPTVIHLLSDGDFPDNEAVLRRIRRLNHSGFVTIDTVCFSEDPGADDPNAQLLKEIASENDGNFKKIIY